LAKATKRTIPIVEVAAISAQPNRPHRLKPQGANRIYMPTICWRK